MIPQSFNSSIAEGFDRYRGVVIRVAGIVAVAVVGIFGIRYMIGGGPEEKYRFSHPSGYSVIRPRDWMATAINRPDSDGFADSILLVPEREWAGLQPNMWVKRYSAAPDLTKIQTVGFSQATFQGRPAWISQQQPKRHLIRAAIFQRGDDWFNVGVALPGLEGAKADDWWRYIESFRTIDPLPPNKPDTRSETTHPAG